MELLKTDDGARRCEEDFLLEQDYRQYLLRFETAKVFGRKKRLSNTLVGTSKEGQEYKGKSLIRL